MGWTSPRRTATTSQKARLHHSPQATEVHVGARYTFGQRRPVSLSFGAYSDPDHDGVREVDTDTVHLTAGAGAALTERLRLEGAVRVSDQAVEGVVSAGVRF